MWTDKSKLSVHSSAQSLIDDGQQWNRQVLPWQTVDTQVLLGADSGWANAAFSFSARLGAARDVLDKAQRLPLSGCNKYRVIRTWVLPLLFGCENAVLSGHHADPSRLINSASGLCDASHDHLAGGVSLRGVWPPCAVS